MRAKPNADYDETIITTAYQAQTGRRPCRSSRNNYDETTGPTIEEADDEDEKELQRMQRIERARVDSLEEAEYLAAARVAAEAKAVAVAQATVAHSVNSGTCIEVHSANSGTTVAVAQATGGQVKERRVAELIARYESP